MTTEEVKSKFLEKYYELKNFQETRLSEIGCKIYYSEKDCNTFIVHIEHIQSEHVLYSSPFILTKSNMIDIICFMNEINNVIFALYFYNMNNKRR